MGELKYGTRRLIDSVWTLVWEELTDRSIRIHSYSRDNPIGYEREKELPRIDLFETKKDRTVVGVKVMPYFQFLSEEEFVEGTVYMVANSKHIFDYPYKEGEDG